MAPIILDAAHHFDKVGEIHGLDDVSRDSQVEGFQTVVGLRRRGLHDDRQAAQLIVSLDDLEKFQAIHSRHV